MAYTGEFKVYEDIIEEMSLVYQHDKRPWMIGFSGGKDSTLLCCLVMEMLQRLPAEKRNKTVYIVSSDTMVENPIVRDYMHRMSDMINKTGAELNIKADIIYPKVEDTFWSKVIGLGYPTPEAPGFRWCTERLKIHPMNAYTLETIKNNGEVVLLLGVRKAESTYRANNIRAREIEGKLLVPHNDIENAYVYNPLTEIPNEEVWNFLLKGNAISPWGSDNKYLFSLYQGENLGEEQSVIGEIDKDKIAVTGNSRFGCWICTVVKDDKSMNQLIKNGISWMQPLLDFRNRLAENRNKSENRCSTRRNGQLAVDENGHNMGNYTMEYRIQILRELLQIQKDTQQYRSSIDLITSQELVAIQVIWYRDGNFTTTVNDVYNEVYGYDMPNDNITLQERILLEKACSDSNHYRLIQELLALQKNKVLLMKKQGLQNDLEERINDFVKSTSK